MNLGLVVVAAPKVSPSSVSRYSRTAWGIIGVNRTGCPVIRGVGIPFLDICTDQAGIHGNFLTAHELFLYATRDGRLKYVAQQITAAE